MHCPPKNLSHHLTNLPQIDQISRRQTLFQVLGVKLNLRLFIHFYVLCLYFLKHLTYSPTLATIPTNSPSSFWCSETTVQLAPGGTANLDLEFLPLSPGPRNCALLFSCSGVGEFLQVCLFVRFFLCSFVCLFFGSPVFLT